MMFQLPGKPPTTAGNIHNHKYSAGSISNLLLPVILLLSVSAAAAQDILFTVKSRNIPVPANSSAVVTSEEFERAYTKNKGLQRQQDIHIRDFLEMYINFKLKVIEAVRLGYDTIPSFTAELEDYLDQISKPYKRDAEIMEKLIREAYYRTVTERNVSHILVLIPGQGAPSDTVKAWDKINHAYSRLLSGESFETVAADISEDITVKQNKGNIGWIYAFLMVYPFEDAAYRTPPGGISRPFRTDYGYHIISVNGERPASGEVSLAHIMTVAVASDDSLTIANAGINIRNYYRMIEEGMEFGEAAKLYSEDASSALNRGQMRWIRTGELPPEIEDEVFALKDSGSYTTPLRSVYGWHIFQLKDKKEFGNLEEMRDVLTDRLMVSERAQIAVQAVTARLKLKYNLSGTDEEISRAINDSVLYLEYPDLKYLSKEYYEGILLFNISNEMVWQKANDDTTGFEIFRRSNQTKLQAADNDEERGALIASYQDHLEKEWVNSLREQYMVKVNKRLLKKIGRKY